MTPLALELISVLNSGYLLPDCADKIAIYFVLVWLRCSPRELIGSAKQSSRAQLAAEICEVNVIAAELPLVTAGRRVEDKLFFHFNRNKAPVCSVC